MALLLQCEYGTRRQALWDTLITASGWTCAHGKSQQNLDGRTVRQYARASADRGDDGTARGEMPQKGDKAMQATHLVIGGGSARTNTNVPIIIVAVRIAEIVRQRAIS
jgi:hypothetical protein